MTRKARPGKKIAGTFKWLVDDKEYSATDIHIDQIATTTKIFGFTESSPAQQIMELHIENNTENGQYVFDEKKGLTRAAYNSTILSTAYAGSYNVTIDNGSKKYALEADLSFIGYARPIHIELDVSA